MTDDDPLLEEEIGSGSTSGAWRRVVFAASGAALALAVVLALTLEGLRPAWAYVPVLVLAAGLWLLVGLRARDTAGVS